jgi:hypothetical protein
MTFRVFGTKINIYVMIFASLGLLMTICLILLAPTINIDIICFLLLSAMFAASLFLFSVLW